MVEGTLVARKTVPVGLAIIQSVHIALRCALVSTKIRKHIVVLPDASLQQPVTIRTAISDFRCCQSVA
jgi:hypothetical protein